MKKELLLSIIICTYRRADAVTALLESLASQLYTNFETIIVDGSGEDDSVRRAVTAFIQNNSSLFSIQIIQSPAGLTRQRNQGLRYSQGDVICFFDDDVTFGLEFLAHVVEIFSQSSLGDVGGITGYDTNNYPTALTFRWKLRRILGLIPSLVPGDIDHLGRAVPLSFIPRFQGYRTVKWLPGCCMIYRRSAIANLQFDESLPTYAGEDRDFSIKVAEQWQLLLFGDLHYSHNIAPQQRPDDFQRVFETGFGMGHSFAKHKTGWSDYMTIFYYSVGECLLDFFNFLRLPSKQKYNMMLARQRGIVAGLRKSN
jgi:glycosyltransferase involved in cell wall biosynthesis